MGRDTARLRSLQRLDLADIQNIQDFVTDYMSLALGGLFGYTRGLLTPPEVRVSGENGGRAFNLTAFQVAISETGNSGVHNEGGARSDVKLQVVRFDPTDSNHLLNGAAITNGLIEYQNGDANKFLCVRTVPVDEDSQNRVFWSVASNTESAQSTKTTTRTRLEFNWRTDETLIEDEEAPILILTNDSPGEAQRVKLISAWDDYKTYQFLRENVSFPTNNWYDHTSLIGVSPLLDEDLRPGSPTPDNEGLDGLYSPDALSYTRDLGLNMLLALYRSRMRRVMSQGSADDASVTETSWATQPAFSLDGLNQKVDSHIASRHTLRHQAIIKIEKDASNNITFDLVEELSLNIASISSVTFRHHGGEYYADVSLLSTTPGGIVNFSKDSVIHYETMTDSGTLFDVSNEPQFPGKTRFYGRHLGSISGQAPNRTIRDVFSPNFQFLLFSDDVDYFHDGAGSGTSTNFSLKVSIYGTITP